MCNISPELNLQAVSLLVQFCSVLMYLTFRCAAPPPDPGGFVQPDWCVPRGGSQHVGPYRLQLEPAALRPGSVQTRSQQRERESTLVQTLVLVLYSSVDLNSI